MSRDVRTFVLIHGAWAGGWGMQRLADRLLAAAHIVHAPTLSGLGERSHLADRDIDLSTHVADVVNEIRFKDLTDVILVGASYAGLVITQAAEQIGDRLSALAYIDAFVPKNGQSFADMVGMEIADALVPAPDSGPDEDLSAEDQAFVQARVTPQPAGTFTEKTHLTGAADAVATRIYVQATGWDVPAGGTADRLRQDPAWRVHSIDCGHDIAFLRPDDLAAILLSETRP